jgi:hypothetical protein
VAHAERLVEHPFQKYFFNLKRRKLAHTHLRVVAPRARTVEASRDHTHRPAKSFYDRAWRPPPHFKLASGMLLDASILKSSMNLAGFDILHPCLPTKCRAVQPHNPLDIG